MVIVEAMKNIAGLSYFPDYYAYSDLNLRKHQAELCPQLSSTLLVKSHTAATDAAVADQPAEPSIEVAGEGSPALDEAEAGGLDDGGDPAED